MNIILNGTPMHTTCQTLLELLDSQGLTTGRFAVEVDGILIPKTRLTDTIITDGMRVEVVQAVGGG
ncbi:MAG: sulfur carrier protein ThiS [Moraxella sp.]|nr:sulfur carrier protein ThiS [Moraxella sp.]